MSLYQGFALSLFF